MFSPLEDKISTSSEKPDPFSPQPGKEEKPPANGPVPPAPGPSSSGPKPPGSAPDPAQKKTAPPALPPKTPPAPGKPPIKPPAAANALAQTAVKKNKLVVMLALFALVGGGMWGAMKLYERIFKRGPEAPQQGSHTMAINVMEVKLDRFQDTMVAVGTIAGGSEIPLRFEVDGTVDYFEFREGDKVRKGDLIARLNQRETYLKLKRAQLELDQARKLYEIGAVARSKLEEALLAVELAKSDLDKTVLRATRDGILGDKDAEVGEFVTPSKKVATLVNIETVRVRVGIIEKEIDKIVPGLKIVLTVDTYPGVEFTGQVKTINPFSDGTGKTFTVEGELDNDGGLLLPGMFARTRIAIFEEDNAISVPNDALEKTQTGHRVFVVDKENKAHARDVEVGYVSSQFSQITKGLSVGELVVTQKPQELKDGSPVKIIEVQK
jgi:membrane fusion protein (multidrug efflux system)